LSILSAEKNSIIEPLGAVHLDVDMFQLDLPHNPKGLQTFDKILIAPMSRCGLDSETMVIIKSLNLRAMENKNRTISYVFPEPVPPL
jgi:hypothetical protein